jgi:CHASE2 domain-containing sensor protein
MRNIEIILTTISTLMLLFKKITLPYAGVGFAFFMMLLVLFYSTSRLHVFRNNKYGSITSIILSVSIISLLLFHNHWIKSVITLVILSIIQILWFFYLKRKNNKKLLIRVGGITIAYCLTFLYNFLLLG